MTVTVAQLEAWLRRAAERIDAEAERLTDLDSAIGDSDHGTNLRRGFTAVVTGLDGGAPATVPALLKQAGMALVSKTGGASGSLYGTLFLSAAKAAPDSAELDDDDLAAVLRAGVDGVVARGHAELGDKTMLDALLPAVDALGRGAPLHEALATAADAAERGRDSTASLVARKGRASYLGERSVGHLDPGSASAAILVRALHDAVAGDAP